MAVVDVELTELKRLTGRDIGKDELVDDLFTLGVELEYIDDGVMGLEVVPDRPDRLSVEGLARSLRYYYGIDEGIYKPQLSQGDYTIQVAESVSEVRPYVTGAVVRNVDLGGDVLDYLIQLQEKLHSTLGRRRNKGAIGVHDLAMIKGQNITYRGIKPEEESFVPLEIGGEEAREMTPGGVMQDHPVGREYAHILEGAEKVPAIYDDIGLFSFPPVINGKRTEVREDSRDLLVEMTGTDEWTIDKMLNILLYSLDARGAEIEEVTVSYEGGREKLKPDFSTKTKRVPHDRIESVLGMEFEPGEVVELVRRSGMDAEANGDYIVEVPPYRTDIMHPLDVIDDIGRAYGFNELEPRYPEVSTIGELTEGTRLENMVRRQLIGLGFQDLLNFVLTNPEDNYTAMNLERDEGVYIQNPYSEEYSMMRSWLLPSLVTVLGNNTHREYPQELAEIGVCAQKGDTETGVEEITRVAALVCSADTGYETVKSRLESLVKDFDHSLETPATDHPSFVPGRVADVVINGTEYGTIGELHPEVLARHEVAMPAAAFEFDIEALR